MIKFRKFTLVVFVAFQKYLPIFLALTVFAVGAFAENTNLDDLVAGAKSIGNATLVIMLYLAAICAVGVIVWGAFEIRRGGEGMVKVVSGLFVALIVGLALVIVSRFTGQNLSTGY